MKRFTWMVAITLAVLLGFMAKFTFADQFSDDVAKAQKLKKEGKYAEAAKAHPRVLCQSEYLWNAACKLVGHRNKYNNWVYDDEIATPENVKQALAYLDEAEAKVKQVNKGDDLKEGDDGTCKGVDPDDLLMRIDLVRACCQGHCK